MGIERRPLGEELELFAPAAGAAAAAAAAAPTSAAPARSPSARRLLHQTHRERRSRRVARGRQKHLSFNTPRAAAALLPVRAPPLPSDLNEGYPDGWRESPYRASVSDVVLAARACGVDPFDCDVVSFRANLRQIFGCCFDPRKEWTVDAIALDSEEGEVEGGGEADNNNNKKKKTVFLEIVKEEGEGSGRAPFFQDQDRFFYWGFKFESLCFGGDSNGEPVRVGRTEVDAVLVRELPAASRGATEAAPSPASSSPAGPSSSDASSSAPLKLLVVAEMDGFDEGLAVAAGTGEKETTATTTVTTTAATTATLPPTLPPMSSLVELKTLKWPEPGRDWALFNLKAPTWWLQCFLG